jgi:hypothetical protein
MKREENEQLGNLCVGEKMKLKRTLRYWIGELETRLI